MRLRWLKRKEPAFYRQTREERPMTRYTVTARCRNARVTFEVHDDESVASSVAQALLAHDDFTDVRMTAAAETFIHIETRRV